MDDQAGAEREAEQDAGRRRPKADGRGGFFAIDRRAWRMACDIRVNGAVSINAAVAYLVLACGTGGDNRTTKWSAKAIHDRTGIARARAASAIKALQERGLVWLDPTSKPDRPKYRLVPAHEVPGCPGCPPAQAPAHPRLLAAMGDSWIDPPKTTRDFEGWGSICPRPHIEEMVRAGHVEAHSDGRRFRARRFDPEAFTKPDWIWLPNAVVSGAADETPPVELLRQASDVAMLQMFVELYAQHSLADDGGIHFRTVRETFERSKVGEQGALIVWGFKLRSDEVWPHRAAFASHYQLSAGEPKTPKEVAASKAFWSAWAGLKSLGLIDAVTHLVNADTDEGEVLFPLPVGSHGLPAEHAVASAARAAAQVLITEGQERWATENGLLSLVPLRRHIEHAQLVGIFRLRYRPKTARTLQFMARTPEWQAVAEEFRAIAGTDTSRDHQGTIKGPSRTLQGAINDYA